MTKRRDPPEPRDRSLPIQVYVNTKERKALAARAWATGLSMSAYLRAAGMGVTIKSVLDLEAVAALAKISGEQARVATAILEHAGPIASRPRVMAALTEIEQMQQALREAVKKVKT